MRQLGRWRLAAERAATVRRVLRDVSRLVRSVAATVPVRVEGAATVRRCPVERTAVRVRCDTERSAPEQIVVSRRDALTCADAVGTGDEERTGDAGPLMTWLAAELRRDVLSVGAEMPARRA